MKEAAAWAIACISKHNEKLALEIIKEQAVPQLVVCLQEPEIELKRISAKALSEIAKHSDTTA